MKPRHLILLAALFCSLASAASAAPAAASPIWNLDIHHNQTNFPPGGTAQYWFVVDNVGDTATSGPITLTVNLPSGISRDSLILGTWSCPGSPGDTTVVCTSTIPVPRHFDVRRLALRVDVAPGASGTLITTAEVSGGGAANVATAAEPTAISADDPGFGILTPSFVPDFYKADEIATVRQAGAHPPLLTTPFDFTSVDNPSVSNFVNPYPKKSDENVRHLHVDAPPGFIGNPTAVGECSQAQFVLNACPLSSQVGRVDLDVYPLAQASFTDLTVGVFNLTHSYGTLTDLALSVVGNPVHIKASLDPANLYAITTTVPDINETLPPFDQKLTLWGVPADPSHDSERCSAFSVTSGFGGAPAPGDTSNSCSTDHPLQPFLTVPFQCTADNTWRLHDYDSWQNPGVYGPDITYTQPGRQSGCEQEPFAPSVSVAPTTDAADSASGLDVGVQLPQNESCDPGPPVDCGIATSPLKDATVALPEGLTANPATANGLDACTPAQISLGTDDPVTCPDASRIADAEVSTPALPDPIEGVVYLATPHNNPFDSLLAGYIVFDDPDRGVLIKIPGKIEVNPSTGQLTGSFKDNPQLPFSELHLHFQAGAYAALITPKTCGTYTSNADFAPWSGNPAASPSDSFTINGAGCPASESDQPNSPSFDAGPVSPISKHYTPFVLHLRREDGTQRFGAFKVTLPPGMTGKLAGTALCSDAALAAAVSKSGKAEQASPSCPLDSHVGEVVAGTGAGPSPYYARGDAYLAGPYKGAPVSLAVITPAVAGPFDLGTIVIRTPLYIDPTTAQITAVSDPIPQMLEGIPTDVRSVDVVMDRPDFTLTGTSCDPASVDGLLTSTLDQTAPLSVKYQLSDCDRLGFKPKFKLSLKGGTNRNGHPAFKTTISYPQGDYSNLSFAQVVLPKQIQLDQSHIQAPCTRPQFAAGQCPAASVIGTATATSPLVDYALTGPVYLRTGDNPLPDVVLALHGPPSQPIEIDQVGVVDTQNARLRTTFETIPDAPLSSAVVSLVGGHKGLLVNNSSLCAGPDVASLRLAAHNNKTLLSNPKVAVKCPKHKKRKAKHHKKHRHHKRHKRHHKRHAKRHHKRAVR